MKNFEFKSQICTDINQSRKLLELGLKKETADMRLRWLYCHRDEDYYQPIPNDFATSYDDIPAWSLHRLIELYSDVEDTSSLSIKDVSYKLLIFCIEKAIHCRVFNKDYLEERE